MIDLRDEVEHEIWWKTKKENVSFWFDNWTKLGPLYFLVDNPREKEIEVNEFT